MEEEAVKMNTKVIQSFEVGHFNYSKHNLSHFLFEKCKFFLFLFDIYNFAFFMYRGPEWYKKVLEKKVKLVKEGNRRNERTYLNRMNN